MIARRQAIAIVMLTAALLTATAGGAQVPTDSKAAAVNLLFIHHSCGGQLMAAEGPAVGGEAGSGERCIYVSHPNGGGLRDDLVAAGFQVNEASYGSGVGEDTDICHWHAKFRDQMDRILRTARQDEMLPKGQTNQIVAFKSCYPNNQFQGPGDEPGDPDSCERSVANAKAAYRAILPYLEKQPDVLFVAFTAPPLAEPKPVGWKAKLKAFFKGKPDWDQHAREFNTWLANPTAGWLAGYEVGNVVVFDYYDILTDHGATNWSAYPTRGGLDSHPSRTGNRRAAEAFVPFLDWTWSRFSAASTGQREVSP